MKKTAKKFGFTIIEVALFLAVTGALFAGIAIGTQNSISQQRFTDAVQNYAEFLRSVYSEVSNPQSVSDGRSETLAIYGKLIVFGEKTGLDGTDLTNSDEQRIYVYDVVGDVVGRSTESGSAESLLAHLGANVVKIDKIGEVYRAEPAGIVEDYLPRWGSQIETTGYSGANGAWTGSVLVVRHPRSGTINTLVSEKIIEVNQAIVDFNNLGTTDTSTIDGLLADKLSGGDFEADTVDFCVNPYGRQTWNTFRRDVRLVKNARNASGVEIIDMDSDDNLCRNPASA